MGDESLTKPFIIIITFIGLSAIIIMASGEIQYWSVSHSEVIEGWETIGGFDMDFWNPTAGFDVEADDTQIHDESPYYVVYAGYDNPDNYYAFTVPYGSGSAIRVWVFRDNPDYSPGSDVWAESETDFFLITRQTQDWPIHNVRKAVVSFNEVIASDMGDNRSMVSFKLGQLTNCSLLINAIGPINNALANNTGYTIRITTPVGATLGSASMWTVLGQLLGMKLPNCHPVVNAMLAIPMWAGIGFVAVTIISRFIPFISGG